MKIDYKYVHSLRRKSEAGQMKFFHISDLHIGKRVNGFSMLEDQRWILGQILELAGEEQPDGVLIAGDLYDKQLPSAEAVQLVDDFLYGFVERGIPVFAVSGNHDSAERVAYGARMLERSGLYLSRVFDGTLQCVPFVSKSGERAAIYLLPFVRPSSVRRFFPDEEITTTQQAVEEILEHTELSKDCVNILVMHQFMLGAVSCESEELSVGGSDQVDASLTEAFDYVALGHLHGPQRVGRETARYCGSPLKYSFSEATQKKSVTVVEIGSENCVKIRTLPLTPLHDLREIRGPIGELLSPEVAAAANPEDYLHVTLTDEGEVLDAIGRLRAVYPNIMRLDFARKESQELHEEELRLGEKSPQELFAEFFEKQYGTALTEEQRQMADGIWRRLGETEQN